MYSYLVSLLSQRALVKWGRLYLSKVPNGMDSSTRRSLMWCVRNLLLKVLFLRDGGNGNGNSITSSFPLLQKNSLTGSSVRSLILNLNLAFTLLTIRFPPFTCYSVCSRERIWNLIFLFNSCHQNLLTASDNILMIPWLLWKVISILHSTTREAFWFPSQWPWLFDSCANSKGFLALHFDSLKNVRVARGLLACIVSYRYWMRYLIIINLCIGSISTLFCKKFWLLHKRISPFLTWKVPELSREMWCIDPGLTIAYVRTSYIAAAYVRVSLMS